MSIVSRMTTGKARSKFSTIARCFVAGGFLGVALLAGQVASAASAALPQHACTPELEELLADWQAAGFETPSKPSQAIVHGRDGRIAAGPEVTAMASQIRQAIADCQRGDVEAVRQRVAFVTDRLHRQS